MEKLSGLAFRRMMQALSTKAIDQEKEKVARYAAWESVQKVATEFVDSYNSAPRDTWTDAQRDQIKKLFNFVLAMGHAVHDYH